MEYCLILLYALCPIHYALSIRNPKSEIDITPLLQYSISPL